MCKIVKVLFGGVCRRTHKDERKGYEKNNSCDGDVGAGSVGGVFADLRN